ncbi:hypothetical protein ABPG74_018165 [Tetrahymena malaccensis]
MSKYVSRKSNQLPVPSSSVKSIIELLQENVEELQSWTNVQSNQFSWLPICLKDEANGLKFEVETDQKMFNFSKKRGNFVWHKNINLPPIQISNMQKSNDINVNDLMAFCISVKGIDCGVIRQVDLRGSGVSVKSFKHKKVVFNHLRIEETSYNNKEIGGLFYLVIVIFSSADSAKLKMQLENRGEKQISKNSLQMTPLQIIVSSPLHVEARKKSYQHRVTYQLAQNKTHLFIYYIFQQIIIQSTHYSLIDPFLPDFLFRKLYVSNQKVGDYNEIKDTSEDIYLYFTAQNIRHKILHPFFLRLKFPKVIHLYYNQNIIPGSPNIKDLLFSIQQQLYKSYYENTIQQSLQKQKDQKYGQENISVESPRCYEQQDDNEEISEKPQAYTFLEEEAFEDIEDSASKFQERQEQIFGNKLLILQIMIPVERQNLTKINKIEQFLQLIKSKAVGFTFYSQYIPSHFAPIDSKEETKLAYTQIYNQLSSIKFNMFFGGNKSIHSHIRVQKKGDVPRDATVQAVDQETDGPFHQSIYSLDVENPEIRKTLIKIKAVKPLANLPEQEANHQIANVKPLHRIEKDLLALADAYVRGSPNYIIFYNFDQSDDTEDTI